MQPLDFFKKNWIVLLCFFILIFIIYGQSLAGNFVYDDRNIVENTDILTDIEHIDQIIMHPFWSEESGLYRPVTLLSYTSNFVIFGNGPASFHFINLILYVLVCFFIYLLIKKLFKKDILAFIAALLFLLLPIHSEVVANISGRGELLALLFSLLVLLEFAKEKTNFWFVLLWSFLGIGSKETAIAVLPLVFLVLYIKDASLPNRIGKKILEIIKKYFREISSVVVALCFYFFLRFFALGPANFLGVKTSLIENPLMFTDTGSRIATAFKILWMYFEKMFWPVNLCSDYSYNQITIIHNFLNIESILGFMVFLSSIILIFVFINKKPVISFGLGVFFFSFLPVSNLLFPTGTIAGERLFFFPSLGLALIISLIIYKILILIKKDIFKTTFAVFIGIVFCVYGIISLMQQSVWLNEENLFQRAVKCAPNSVLSRSNSGAIYLIKGDLDKAENELKLAMSIKPIYSKGINNLGLVYFRKGDSDKARALYFEAIKQEFPYEGTYENLALLYLSEKNINMAKHWLTYLYPNNEELVNNLIKNYQEQSKK